MKNILSARSWNFEVFEAFFAHIWSKSDFFRHFDAKKIQLLRFAWKFKFGVLYMSFMPENVLVMFWEALFHIFAFKIEKSKITLFWLKVENIRFVVKSRNFYLIIFFLESLDDFEHFSMFIIFPYLTYFSSYCYLKNA